MKTFNLTPELIQLLRRANVSWNGSEYGAPCIDPKRPYGNSDVVSDINAMLDDGVSVLNDDGDWPPGYYDHCRLIHEQTATALQIVLYTGEFTPGTYTCDDYRDNWTLVAF